MTQWSLPQNDSFDSNQKRFLGGGGGDIAIIATSSRARSLIRDLGVFQPLEVYTNNLFSSTICVAS